jgi:hypothetical protein
VAVAVDRQQVNMAVVLVVLHLVLAVVVVVIQEYF